MVFLVMAQHDHFPVDPHDLPGKILIEFNQEIKGFPEVIRFKGEHLEPFNILQTPPALSRTAMKCHKTEACS
jgi:hypothetical protein